jgi:hypothetical protein
MFVNKRETRSQSQKMCNQQLGSKFSDPSEDCTVMQEWNPISFPGIALNANIHNIFTTSDINFFLSATCICSFVRLKLTYSSIFTQFVKQSFLDVTSKQCFTKWSSETSVSVQCQTHLWRLVLKNNETFCWTFSAWFRGTCFYILNYAE